MVPDFMLSNASLLGTKTVYGPPAPPSFRVCPTLVFCIGEIKFYVFCSLKIILEAAIRNCLKQTSLQRT